MRERIAAGRLVEGVEHASEDYLKALELTLIVSADTELISAPSYHGPAATAPNASSNKSIV
jgi:ring-1,2-phenylacetyl-CoA epoxidase subunit PaaA